MKKTIWLLAFILLCTALTAQNGKKVSGTVTDEHNQPMIGTAVVIDGTSNGAVTDAAGKFSLTVPSSETVLRFESLGYKTVKMKVGALTHLAVTMQPDVSYLDEVVVIGFGETKKSDLTGSVANVKMSDIENSPTLSVDQALQGKVAGADIMSTDGDPSSGTSIRIRGSRSINASNEPLIVVDGVMNAVNDLGDINSSDIESISVLKDASSTAIYGAQGANGVIIVTTKAGSTTQSKANVTLTVKAGFAQLARSLDYMNAMEFATYNNDRIDFSKGSADGATWPVTPSYNNKYNNPEALGEGTDWLKAITRIAPYQQYGISVSGGTKKTNYFASVAYINNQGVIIASGAQRISGKFTIGHKFNKWLKLTYNANIMYRRNDNNKAAIGGTGVWAGTVYISPVLGIEDTINDLYNYGQGSPFNNPYISTQLVENYRASFANTQNLTLQITPVKGLTIKSSNTYYKYDSHLYKFEPGTLPARRISKVGGEANRQDNDTRQLNSDNTITYKTDIKRRHHLNAMAGFSVYYNDQNTQAIQAKGMLVDKVKWDDLSGIGDKNNYTITSDHRTIKRMSFMGRFNYDFKKRYFLTFTARSDGSSNFAANRKWGFFPSGAFKWNIANEAWVKKTHIFQDLSLRLSAGRTGNDAIAPYKSLYALDSSTSGYIIGGSQSTYYYPTRLSSPDLTWETTDMYNAALDIAMLKGRLKITAEAYLSKTKDLLLSVQKANQTGYSNYTENLGRTSNKGLELSIEGRNIIKRNFSWTTEFTISHNKQMVEDIGTEDFVTAMTDQKGYMIYGYVKGYPLNSLWGFQYGGVWHNLQEVSDNAITHQFVDYYSTIKLGRPRYVDQDHNGVLDTKDLVWLGDADPVVYGGLQNNFHIFGFDLGVYFSYSIGGKIYNYSEFFMAGTYCSNQYRYMLNGWHPYRNPDSDYPSAGASGSSMLPSSFLVHDASFLRLKTLSLSYKFDLSKRTKAVKSLSLGVSADNLWLWCNYNGFDPDVSTNSDESTIRRADIGAYPKARTIIFTTQLKF